MPPLENGFQAELEYWRKFLTAPHFEAGRNRLLDPERVIDPRFEPYLDKGLMVLDVGSGPLTVLGFRTSDGRRLQLGCIDPLALEYAKALHEAGLKWVVPIKAMRGEDLEKGYSPNTFNMVFMKNSLDHTQDPLSVFRSAAKVTKPGGHVVLLSYVNEALTNGYAGLHQWNLCFDRTGHLVIWNKSSQTTLGDYSRMGLRLVQKDVYLTDVTPNNTPGKMEFFAVWRKVA